MNLPGIFRVSGALLLLLSPVFLYLFFHFFGENHYEVPTYFEKPPEGSHQSLSRVDCMSHGYPYRVFSHPSGNRFFKEGVSLYVIHNLSTENSNEWLTTFYEKVNEKGSVQMYGFLEKGLNVPLPPTRSNWLLKELTPDGFSYLRDCVLHVMDLFEVSAPPTAWAILLDAKGRIRGFFNPESEKDFRKGLAEAFIMQETSKEDT